MKEFFGKYTSDQKLADIHMHTNGSDGHLAPWQIIDLAVASNLDTIAITDHNTITPAIEAKEYGLKNAYPLDIVIGTEISTSDGHLLGLYLEYDIPNRKSAEWTIQQIHTQGGLAIAPHPFYKRVRSLTKDILLSIMNNQDPQVHLDGIEIFNASVNDNPKTTATEEAIVFYNTHKDKLGAAIGSTDGHYFTVGRGMTGYRYGLKEAIKARETSVLFLEQKEVRNRIEMALKMFPSEVQPLINKLKKYRNRFNR